MEDNKTIVENLRNALKKGVVRFTYIKKDGSVRQAEGTRNITIAEGRVGCTIPAPKSGRNNENAYYDLEKFAWRSFIPSKVVSIEG